MKAPLLQKYGLISDKKLYLYRKKFFAVMMVKLKSKRFVEKSELVLFVFGLRETILIHLFTFLGVKLSVNLAFPFS